MSALRSTEDLSVLTSRQRQIWEMSQGLGEWEGNPQDARQIADALGVTTNNVYVTRRRAKQILHGEETQHRREPKRILRTGAGGLQTALAALQEQLDGYKDEEATLRARLDQIEREKPEVENTIKRLRKVMNVDTTEEAEPVAS